jgi:hypothetical protein
MTPYYSRFGAVLATNLHYESCAVANILQCTYQVVYNRSMDTGLLILGLHVAYLIVCIIVGLVAFAPQKAKNHSWLMPTFLALLSGFVLFGAGGTIAHWYDMSPVVRAIFVGVIGLGIYALYRGARVKSNLRKEETR